MHGIYRRCAAITRLRRRWTLEVDVSHVTTLHWVSKHTQNVHYSCSEGGATRGKAEERDDGYIRRDWGAAGDRLGRGIRHRTRVAALV